MKKDKYKSITKSESAVFLLVAEKNISKDIAEALGISIHTVKRHKESLAKKLETSGHTELAIEAYKYKLWLEANPREGEK